MDTQLLLIIGFVLLTIVVFTNLQHNRSIEGLDAKPLSSYPEALQNLAAMYKDKKLVVDNLVVTKSIKVGGTEAAPKATIDENGNMTMNELTLNKIKLANKWQLGDTGDHWLRINKINGNGTNDYYGGIAVHDLYAEAPVGNAGDQRRTDDITNRFNEVAPHILRADRILKITDPTGGWGMQSTGDYMRWYARGAQQFKISNA